MDAMTPKRIQRKRTKGWRMPAGAICVTRETPYGNPFRIGDPNHGSLLGEPYTRASAIAAYREWVAFGTYLSGYRGQLPATLARVRQDLRGHDLACWCPLVDESGVAVPCHADVLLELANR